MMVALLYSNGQLRTERDGDTEKGCQKAALQQTTTDDADDVVCLKSGERPQQNSLHCCRGAELNSRQATTDRQLTESWQSENGEVNSGEQYSLAMFSTDRLRHGFTYDSASGHYKRSTPCLEKKRPLIRRRLKQRFDFDSTAIRLHFDRAEPFNDLRHSAWWNERH